MRPGYALDDAAADAADKPTASAMPIAVLILIRHIDHLGAVQNGELRPRQSPALFKGKAPGTVWSRGPSAYFGGPDLVQLELAGVQLIVAALFLQ